VLLAVTALASSLIMAATNPAPTSTPAPSAPALPQTQPGLSHDEGVFLVTSADDGSRAVYFIASNARHSITASDMQLELQVNPLWPVRQVSQDEALNFDEGAPIGNAHTGLIGASAAPEPQPAPEPTVYVLLPGDNLIRIAGDYGTTVEDILAANGISDANHVYAGQALVIPYGDTLSNSADVPTAVAADPDPADASTTDAQATYTVGPGDSAIKIARGFGIDEDTLLQANNISDPDRVYVGQVLTIPASS
jgi:LysM repeat protein